MKKTLTDEIKEKLFSVKDEKGLKDVLKELGSYDIKDIRDLIESLLEIVDENEEIIKRIIKILGKILKDLEYKERCNQTNSELPIEYSSDGSQDGWQP